MLMLSCDNLPLATVLVPCQPGPGTSSVSEWVREVAQMQAALLPHLQQLATVWACPQGVRGMFMQLQAQMQLYATATTTKKFLRDRKSNYLTCTTTRLWRLFPPLEYRQQASRLMQRSGASRRDSKIKGSTARGSYPQKHDTSS